MPLESAALDPRRKTELYGVDGMRSNAGLTPTTTVHWAKYAAKNTIRI